MNWKHERLINLRPFQHKFLKQSFSPGILTSCLSTPRGNGKSTMAAFLSLQTILPGSPMFTPGAENHLIGASLAQSRRTTFGILRRMVEALPNFGTDYRVSDNSVSARIVHPASRTEISVLTASGRGAMGIVNCAWIVGDEPAAWKIVDGQTMADAIVTAHGKPGSRLKVLFCGTLAPAAPGSWWSDMVANGSNRTTHITCYQGDPDKWDQWQNIRRCNPLMSTFANSRRVLLDERDAARRDSRLRARFLSYRLNSPARDESAVLLQVADWKRTLARILPERDGAPVVGLDLGQGRAWSAACAIWPSGRCEAAAVAPGIPSIQAQEKRDGVEPHTYARLLEVGALRTAEGKRVPDVSSLMNTIRSWGPSVILCDRFRHSEVLDSDPPCIVIPRVSRWSSSTEDITHLRRIAADGPLAVAPGSRSLIGASLAVSQVKNDDAGNVRLTKSGQNTARDDVSAALILAAGEWARRRRMDATPAYFAFAAGGGSGEVVVM